MKVVARTTPEKNAWGEPPLKVRNHTIDSLRWSGFRHRPGDVFIATWAKSGTTWVQQIVAQLIFGAGSKKVLNEVSPWLENRYFSFQQTRWILERQEHRRFVKTHLPATALPYRAGARYIYIARDGRDAVWSWHNHHMSLRPEVYEQTAALSKDGVPPLRPPTRDIRRFFIEWLEGDGFPLWPYWSHINSWWSIRHLPNVLLLHFCDLKSDLVETIRKIAVFINVEVNADELQRIANCCTFSYMKTHAHELLPEYGKAMTGGASSFIHRGKGGDWQGVLSPSDVSRYEATMVSELGADCANWLAQPYSDFAGNTPNRMPILGTGPPKDT